MTRRLTNELTEKSKAPPARPFSQAYYRSVLDSLRVGVVVVDAETREIVEANPFIAELTGLAEAELVGRAPALERSA